MNAESSAPLQDQIGARACLILKLVVERFILEGQPIGSRTLSENTGLKVSAATIRHTLSDLERLGFLRAPHTSAGRVPTAAGYRYFVDTLLSPQRPELGEHESLHAQLLRRMSSGEELASGASRMLSQLSRLAAVVSVPRQNHSRFRHIEFVRLAERRVLAILVVDEKEVQNRVLELQDDLSQQQLSEVARNLNENFAGRNLLHLREYLEREVEQRRQQLNQVMQQVAQFAEQLLQGAGTAKLAVSGRGNLLADDEQLDPERLRGLFDALDRKRDMLSLLNRCLDASGIRIYIGQEAGYEVLNNCSLITAPYRVDGEIAGVLGVIGPQRMDYARVIPLVNATANALDAALKSPR